MNFVEDEFNFEELTSKMIRKKSPNLLFLLPGLFCILGFAITLYSHFYEKDGSSLLDIGFYVLMGIILLSLSVFTFNNAINLILFDKRYIAFYAKSPDKKSVDDFLQQILVEQKKYLLNRYAKVDHYLSPDQHANNLQWLWDRKIINDAELNELRIKVLPKPNNNESVGFKIGNSDN
jgi:hypothetical protein